MSEDKEYSPYCEECNSCGDDGCCPPDKCKYSRYYLRDAQKQILDLKTKLALAVEALDAANGVIDLLTAYNVGVSFLSEERVELAMEKYRAALEKLRGEK